MSAVRQEVARQAYALYMTANASDYTGRFAPTPSGPLHFGSLLTALASWLCARHVGGRWLIRVDDLDRRRCRDTLSAMILKQLEAHGLWWDGTPHYQSSRAKRYRAVIEEFDARGHIYQCTCTRAVLRQGSRYGCDGPVYDGHCRATKAHANGVGKYALRLRAPHGSASFVDNHFGKVERDLQHDIGDFIVKRTDGVIGYHLACAVDEHDLGITDVVRGGDLLLSTLCQKLILSLLDTPMPSYQHLPVLTANDGRKLSKQNGALPVDAANASGNLLLTLGWLGQSPPADLEGATPETILKWAVAHWNVLRIPQMREISSRCDGCQPPSLA